MNLLVFGPKRPKDKVHVNFGIGTLTLIGAINISRKKLIYFVSVKFIIITTEFKFFLDTKLILCDIQNNIWRLSHPQAPLYIRYQAQQQGGPGPETEGRKQHHHDAHHGHRRLPGCGAPSLHHDGTAHNILEVRKHYLRRYLDIHEVFSVWSDRLLIYTTFEEVHTLFSPN